LSTILIKTKLATEKQNKNIYFQSKQESVGINNNKISLINARMTVCHTTYLESFLC